MSGTTQQKWRQTKLVRGIMVIQIPMAFLMAILRVHFFDNFHNTFRSSVIPGIRLPVPRRQQRQEMNEPRVFDNGTKQQEQRSCQRYVVDILPTISVQLINTWCGTLLDIDE